VKVHFIPVSQNAKTGPIPVSIIERASCWPGCALYENGCYAETGALAMHWDRVSHGLTGGSWSAFCAKIAALRPGRLWRYAQAGDLPGYGARIDGKLLRELVIANAGKRAIAFTHKPVLGDDPVAAENRHLIAASAMAGFTVNLSANNPAEADRLAELRIAPVVTGSPAPMRVVRSGTGSSAGATSGPRRSANGVTARLHCRDTRPREGGLRFARRPIPTPPARAVAPAPMPGMP
jgi:hypothetical protein